MNLPNSISAARIIAAPVIALLPFIPSVTWRAVAFVLYIITAVSDHIDGKIARSRGLITDLGKVLDPLADKLLLVCTFVPMFLLQGAPTDPLLKRLPEINERSSYAFTTWGIELIWFPWWILVLILGREAFMTWFREFARKRGEVIAAQPLGKWKAGFQYTWVGAAYFWFGLKLAIEQRGWSDGLAHLLADFVGAVGGVTMLAAFALTLISLADYMIRHHRVFFRSSAA